MSSEERYTQITLRIPRDLHTKLRAAAGNASHSMNAEIVQRLDGSFSTTNWDELLQRFVALQRLELARSNARSEWIEALANVKSESPDERAIIDKLKEKLDGANETYYEVLFSVYDHDPNQPGKDSLGRTLPQDPIDSPAADPADLADPRHSITR